MPQHTGIQIFTTQLLTSKERLEGLEASIVANSSEKAINEIIVLAEGLNQIDQKNLESRYPKLRLLPCNERPDFAILIQTVCDHGNANTIKIICNSDIWLDLSHSDLGSLLKAFQTNPNLVFTLTRRHDDHPEQLLSVDGISPEFLSSDAWIFAESPRSFPCNGIFLGTQDMERLVNATLKMQGYTLANACGWLRAIHLETSSNNYRDYNQDWLQQIVRINPLLSASSIHKARAVLPICHGHVGNMSLQDHEQFTPLWEEFVNRLILLDLSQASHIDTRLSLLWLLALAYNHNRYLIAYVSQKTDPVIIDLFDRFHLLTGRSLCIKGFSIELLMEQNSTSDRCWASSPAVIGPVMIKSNLPLICLTCREQSPIKKSWLNFYQRNKTSLRGQLQILQGFDPEGATKLADIYQSHSYISLQSDFAFCCEWLYVNFARCTALLFTLLPVNPGIRRCVRNLAKCSESPAYVLEIRNQSRMELLRKLMRWITKSMHPNQPRR